jgi:hypothetical protein
LRNVAFFALVFTGIMVIFSVIVFVYPYKFKIFADNLEPATNIVDFMSMIFSLFALVIASLAFLSSILRPKLKLDIIPYDNDSNDLALAINKDTRKVTITRPLSEWVLLLDNLGNASARYAAVQINFFGAYFPSDAFPGWKATKHAHAFGWYGFQWSAGDSEIIYPKVPINLPTMYFSNLYINENKLDVEIILVADGFNKKTLKFPVKLEFVDFE